jgi:hypothetical protein
VRDLIAVEQAAEQIKVELLSEIMGVSIMRSGFDDAKLVSPPFHLPTTTEDLTVCPWQNLNALIQHTRMAGMFPHTLHSLRRTTHTLRTCSGGGALSRRHLFGRGQRPPRPPH